MLARHLLGISGIAVSVLGFGAGHIGGGDADFASLLDLAFDLGIDFFDSAKSYGASEERLGRWAKTRRDQVVLSTKCGYGVDGVDDWTSECVRLGIDQALGRMHTDYIDVMHLHSCPRDVLERGEVPNALLAAKRAGKIRAIAYSGDNDGRAAALALGVFDVIQTSFNFCDQNLPVDGGKVIAKRPLANAPWRFSERPHHAPDVSEYWHRYKTLALEIGELAWEELALRFVIHTPAVATAIVGTANPEHLRQLAAYAQKEPLPAPVLAHIRERYTHWGRDWPGVV
jgi:aryl-alcohol dehydrogenase-like predicted oxidoreductase